MSQLMKVNFHGTALYGAKVNGEVVVALKPIVEAMGLAWQSQLQRLKRNPILQEGITVMVIPTAQGGPQQSVGLLLTLVHGWLFTISSLRIKDRAVRQRVELFQRECYDVLAKHFLGGNQITAHSAETVRLSISLAQEARLIFGRRAGAQVWQQQGLPITPAMEEAFQQLDLFDRAA